MLSKNRLNNFFGIFLIIVGLYSCKNQKVEQKNEIETKSVYESAEFQEFYSKFSTDSVYQLEHIVFPLEGMKSRKDTLEAVDPNFKWTKENWVIHKPYDDMNSTYGREFIDFSNIVSEKIADGSGQYSMERRFGKLSSGWHLIYYREMGRY